MRALVSRARREIALIMAATRRLKKELEDIKKNNTPCVKKVNIDPSSILNWQILLAPSNPPFSKAGFKVEIVYPAEYPFKPPRITFVTKIYHPNIDEKGQVCLPIISPENWKPATKTDQIIQALVALIHDPEPDHPLRADLAEEYTKDKKKFMKNAEEYTRKFGENLKD